jgi:transcriptional regulator with GAF, ATPase, and Fis domain
MTPRTPAQAFATVAAALVDHDDVADTLSRLLTTCAELLDVSAAALLVRDPSGDLQLLSSTSHKVAELELYQVQSESGPCIDCIRTGAAVSGVSEEELAGRWGHVGRRITGAGFAAVHASPLRWRGEPLGGLNLFDVRELPVDGERGLVAQAFADLATVAIVRSGHVDMGSASLSVRRALEGRTVIERAKGVLAYTRSVDMVTAYDLLVQLTEESGLTLSETAASVIRQAQRQPSAE